jgi:hypothetical protein
MALVITPGYLRPEGPGFVPSRDLRRFVEETTITNFGPDNLGGAALGGVNSSTDPPATASRTRNMLWFRRGEGKLYTWDLSANYTDHTQASGGYWYQVSDRHETLIMVDSSRPSRAYTPIPFLLLSSNVTNTRGVARLLPTVSYENVFDHSSIAIWQEDLLGATDDTVDSRARTIKRGALHGYCWVTVDSGASGPSFGSRDATRMGQDFSATPVGPFSLTPTGTPYAATSPTHGVIVTSTASTSVAQVVQVFLWPTGLRQAHS